MRTALRMHSELGFVGLSTAGLSSGGRPVCARGEAYLEFWRDVIDANVALRAAGGPGQTFGRSALPIGPERAVGRRRAPEGRHDWVSPVFGLSGETRPAVRAAQNNDGGASRGLLSPATAGAPAGCTHAAGGRVFLSKSLDRPALLRGCSRGFENEVGVHRPSTERHPKRSRPNARLEGLGWVNYDRPIAVHPGPALAAIAALSLFEDQPSFGAPARARRSLNTSQVLLNSYHETYCPPGRDDGFLWASGSPAAAPQLRRRDQRASNSVGSLRTTGLV